MKSDRLKDVVSEKKEMKYSERASRSLKRLQDKLTKQKSMIWSSFSWEWKTEEKLTSPIKKKKACLKCDCCHAYKEREEKIKKKAWAYQTQYKSMKEKLKEASEKQEQAPKPPSLKVKLSLVVKWMEELLEKNLEFDQSTSDYAVFINRKHGMFTITPEGEFEKEPGFYLGPEFKAP